MSDIKSRYEIVEVSKGRYIGHIIFSTDEVVTEEYWVGNYYANYGMDPMLCYIECKSKVVSIPELDRLVAYIKSSILKIIDDRNYPRVVEVTEFP
jgi:hypothetical protein